eukprot:tig00000889_g5296.t1
MPAPTWIRRATALVLILLHVSAAAAAKGERAKGERANPKQAVGGPASKCSGLLEEQVAAFNKQFREGVNATRDPDELESAMQAESGRALEAFRKQAGDDLRHRLCELAHKELKAGRSLRQALRAAAYRHTQERLGIARDLAHESNVQGWKEDHAELVAELGAMAATERHEFWFQDSYAAWLEAALLRRLEEAGVRSGALRRRLAASVAEAEAAAPLASFPWYLRRKEVSALSLLLLAFIVFRNLQEIEYMREQRARGAPGRAKKTQ